MITHADDFFAHGCGRCARFDTDDCSTRLWADGLALLREICLAAGLEETAKWGHPCYMHAGRNVAIFGAFRGDFRLSFFHPTLLTDAHQLLERQGEQSQEAATIRFGSAARVQELRPVLDAYLREAMGYAEAGIVPAKVERDVVLPDELIEALDADPALAEAFHALTPGRQRSYVIHLASAKTSATRVARIERARPKIFAGKGATER